MTMSRRHVVTKTIAALSEGKQNDFNQLRLGAGLQDHSCLDHDFHSSKPGRT